MTSIPLLPRAHADLDVVGLENNGMAVLPSAYQLLDSDFRGVSAAANSETPYFTHMCAPGLVDASPIVITTFTFPGFVAVGTIVFTWNTPEFNPGAAPA
jgi:hypothetical protein